MNYIGSKKTLLPVLEEIIKNEIGDISDKVFCDLFAGTGVVGKFFKDKVKKVIANDIEFYSYVLNINYIYINKNIEFPFDLINSLKGINGFIYKNYSYPRLYFTKENARRIDAIRNYLFRITNKDLFYHLMASLLEGVDKIANVASVYGAFLKKFKNSALLSLVVNPAIINPVFNQHNEVFNADANKLIKDIKGDILYLDPPYNGRQYGANYHLLNTIAIQEEFEPRGKTGLPDYYKSFYCRKNKVHDEFFNLIRNAKFEYIILSYNNEGLLSFDEIREIMSSFGGYKVFKKEYRRFKAGIRNYKTDLTTEYFHLLCKI